MKENDEKPNRREEIGVWLEEIKSAKKREKKYREDGEDAIKIYEADKNSPFNILYSNTETLSPALFSQTPRPVVKKRFNDDDPLGKIVSDASQRMIEYLMDTDSDEHESFSTSMENAVLDALLPGRGVTSVKYDAEIVEEEDISSVVSETIYTDSAIWDRVYFGYSKKWEKTPWVAYEAYLDKEEAKEMFGELPDIQFTYGEEDEDENKENEDKGKRKTALVYQIWDKSDRTVKYITPQHKDDYLKVQEDPLDLSGFFNCPRPLTLVAKSQNRTPTALYTLYKNQAEELNNIQYRLNNVIKAIKVRGAYDGQLGTEIEAILKEDDNALVPTDKGGTLLANGGLDKSIWMLPIEKLIVVAQQLYQARESCKQVIYEITGISDIVRGQSKASETLGAQKIKESWGTMRLKRFQGEVQRYALDLIKIMLEVASSKFSEQTWKEMTGLPYPTTEEKEQAEMLVQAAKTSGAEPDQQAMQLAQMPSWGDILEVLNTKKKHYRIDIETNSTLDVEATEDKEHIAEFMNALAQFMNGMMPMIQEKIMPFEVAKSMLLEITSRYRFGRELEDQIKAMQEPQPQQSPELQKAQQELQKAQEEFQKVQQQFEQEKQKAGDQLDEQFRKLDEEKIEFEFAKKMAELEAKYEERLTEARQELNEADAENALKEMIANHRRDIQSMLDKHKAHLDSMSKV